MRLRSAALASLLLGSSLLPAAAVAEDVYLKNGRVFRGVIATVDNGAVQIEMPGGTLSFPVSTVLRIEASDAVYRDYQTRRDALERGGAKAADWLELARWAKSHGLEPAAREAARAAGRLDPDLPGVRSLLGELGFVFDASSGTFLAFEDSMARQGLVYDGGAWITSAERAARRERERAAAAAREADVARPEERAADRPATEEPDTVVGIPLSLAGGYGVGGVSWPGVVVPGGLRPPHPRHPRGRAPCTTCGSGASPMPPAPAVAPLPPQATSARREGGRRH